MSSKWDELLDDPEIEEKFISCTAWDCCGALNELIGNSHGVRIGNGTTVYESADASRTGQTVLFQRLVPEGKWVRAIKRRVDPETPVTIVPFSS